ncbi:hypothetical protein [Streptomyces sp. NPDC097610]|uniref:hypothetical protein n=1 Tax=Streptomyces sp. NPDC097610 TaxID=3157227 RepID=UPI003330AA7D
MEATHGVQLDRLHRDPEDGGYLLHVDLEVKWPEIDLAVAAPLVKKADSLCPYTKLAQRGTPTSIRLASWPTSPGWHHW